MKEMLYNFLKEIDSDFPTPLSERVNLKDYASKIADNAIIMAVFNSGEILGLVALYCNDTKNKYAYIPLVGILPKARGNKLSKTLMNSAISIARETGFETIGIHTENPIALHLYKKLGFCTTDTGNRKYLELKL